MCDERLDRRHRFSRDERISIFHSVTAFAVFLCAGLALLGPSLLLLEPAYAQTRLNADYVVSFARVTVGSATVRAEIGSSAYAISASGQAGGIIRLLIDGNGNLISRGSVAGNRLFPSKFISKINSANDPLDVNMTIENGNVAELTVLPPSGPDRVPITDADQKKISDPLTALFVPADETGNGLNRETCQRTLPIFDGRQRYDLQLDFKRLDKVTANTGYSGPLVVCSLSYRPIAGHRVSIPFIKYLSESREIEIALAPLAGTRLLAPYRLVIANLLANLVVQANRFETNIATTPAPPRSNSNSP